MNILFAFRLWRARGPRFLLLLALAWIALRTTFGGHGGETMRQFPTAPALPTWSAPHPLDEVAVARPGTYLRSGLDSENLRYSGPPRGLASPAGGPMLAAMAAPSVPIMGAASDAPPPSMWAGPDRHRWRLAMIETLLPRQSMAMAALKRDSVLARFPAGELPAPPIARWPDLPGQRWTLAAYSVWRMSGRAAPSLAANRPPTLGGSQAAVRLDYRLNRANDLRGFARLTTSTAGPGGADLAVGLAMRPHAAVPVDLYVEHRFAVAGTARNRTLVYAAGGIDDQPMPLGFRLSAYGQGGIAGPKSPDLFADGAVALDRPLYSERNFAVSLGAMAAAAAQPNARRIDVGPRATIRFPRLGNGARIAVDWRERVAGNADPDSGIAITLAAGF